MYPFKSGDFAPKNGWYVDAFSEGFGEELRCPAGYWANPWSSTVRRTGRR